MTDCIFVKDLSLNFGEYNSHYLNQSKSVSGGGGVSYGPFFLGGYHGSRNTEQNHDAKLELAGGDHWRVAVAWFPLLHTR